MAGHDIFISYSREDRPAARHFAECFAAEGFSVWWDAALRSGETFDEVIEKELRASKAVVVLWSPRSVASRWVRAEATLADRRNKLVPAIIESCDRPIIFELTHAADLADWTGDTSDPRWRGLVDDLRRLAPSADAEDDSALAEESPPAAKPKSRPSAPSQKSAEQGDVADRKLSPPAKVEPLLFVPPQPDEADNDLADVPDATQFCTQLDGIDLHRSDEFHCLQMIEGNLPQTRFVVSPLGLKIGRTAPADIVLAFAGVSRAHCLVELADDRLRVADLNSTNGTFIDGERINRVGFLGVGSILRIGNVSFKHEVHARADLQAQVDPASMYGGASLRTARLARSS